jgi:catechol 2,3-dioxygenase-like lactoylglutathione lyase family enzyme
MNPVITVHHMAFVVSDVDATVEFYRRWFDAEPKGGYDDQNGSDLARVHGLDQVDYRIAFVSIGGTLLEFLQFRTPAGASRVELGGADVGASHVALLVPDVHDLCRQLREAGVQVHSDPIRFADGDAAGALLTYCRDPDGNRIELIQPPAGWAA